MGKSWRKKIYIYIPINYNLVRVGALVTRLKKQNKNTTVDIVQKMIGEMPLGQS